MHKLFGKSDSPLQTFVTGSHYVGCMIESLQIMDGFGVYTYPFESAQYRGFFKDGKFHGYGCMKVLHPQKFEFRGQFSNGVMISIDEIYFSDGLRIKCSQEGGKLNFDKWVYCTSGDRRYSTELSSGLEAVGSNTFVSRVRPDRKVPRGCYDTEEGIYNPKTGFISVIPEPFPPIRFVSCSKERKWIMQRCRRGPTKETTSGLPPALDREAAYCRRIIANNEESTVHLKLNFTRNEDVRSTVTGPTYRPSVFTKATSESSFAMHASSQNCSSFTQVSLIKDVNENIKLEIKNLNEDENSTFFIRNASLMQRRPSIAFISQRFSSLS